MVGEAQMKGGVVGRRRRQGKPHNRRDDGEGGTFDSEQQPASWEG